MGTTRLYPSRSLTLETYRSKITLGIAETSCNIYAGISSWKGWIIDICKATICWQGQVVTVFVVHFMVDSSLRSGVLKEYSVVSLDYNCCAISLSHSTRVIRLTWSLSQYLWGILFANSNLAPNQLLYNMVFSIDRMYLLTVLSLALSAPLHKGKQWTVNIP